MIEMPQAETITAMRLWHLELPVVSRRDHGIGTVKDSVEIIVVELEAASGATGYGEASPWSVFTPTNAEPELLSSGSLGSKYVASSAAPTGA